MNKITPLTMTEREAQNAGTVATDRQGETTERSGRNDPREIPGFPRPGSGMATQAPEAPIPLDPLALDPVEALHLGLGGQPSGVAEYACEVFASIEGRLRLVVNERDTLLKRIAMLKDVIAKMDKLFGAAIRERDEARDGEGVREVVLKAELRAAQRDTHNAIYLAALLFCALCWREGWRVALWIWRML